MGQTKAALYDYNISYDAEEKIYIARCIEMPSITAHGKNQVIALQEVQKAVAGALEWMQEEKEEIPTPLSMRNFSGHITLRMTKDQHRRVATDAVLQGISINKLITSKI